MLFWSLYDVDRIMLDGVNRTCNDEKGLHMEIFIFWFVEEISFCSSENKVYKLRTFTLRYLNLNLNLYLRSSFS